MIQVQTTRVSLSRLPETEMPQRRYRKEKMASKFSIDDAFESDDEDPIRLYGSTSDHVPLKGKTRYSQLPRDQSVERDLAKQTKESSFPGVVKAKAGILRTDSSGSFSNQSDTASVSTKTLSDKHWWNHPKVRENWKIVLASFLLLLIGLGLLVAGTAIEISGATVVQSTVFFIAGAICLIPGAYHVVYICCAVRGKRGFSFYNLPILR